MAFFPGDVVTGKLAVFVEVDSLELDGHAVHKEDVALDFQTAEAHVEAGVLPSGFEQKAVEFGSLGAPLADARDAKGLDRSLSFRNHAAVLVEKLVRHRNGRSHA